MLKKARLVILKVKSVTGAFTCKADFLLCLCLCKKFVGIEVDMQLDMQS